MKRVILFGAMSALMFSVSAWAQVDQKLHYGLRVGPQLTASFDTAPGFNAERTRLVIGPTVTYDITDRFGGIGVQVDLLFRRYRFNELLPDASNPAVPILGSTHGTLVDIPFIGT